MASVILDRTSPRDRTAFWHGFYYFRVEILAGVYIGKPIRCQRQA